MCSPAQFEVCDIHIFGYFGQQTLLKAARMNIYVRRGGPNYQKGLTKMRALGEEIGVPIEVHATISHIRLFTHDK